MGCEKYTLTTCYNVASVVGCPQNYTNNNRDIWSSCGLVSKNARRWSMRNSKEAEMSSFSGCHCRPQPTRERKKQMRPKEAEGETDEAKPKIALWKWSRASCRINKLFVNPLKKWAHNPAYLAGQAASQLATLANNVTLSTIVARLPLMVLLFSGS